MKKTLNHNEILNILADHLDVKIYDLAIEVQPGTIGQGQCYGGPLGDVRRSTQIKISYEKKD